ncbi:MAG: hypothetical protein H7147_01065, partial [Frankiaceae bacterium]|nr:hypothetical protein [Arenimonas sp.]
MTQPSRPNRARYLVLALALALGSAAPASFAKTPTAGVGVDIAYQQFTLPNGLRVIVHTDRKAPIVAVNLW